MNWLKRSVARKELQELERWRLWTNEHHKWLSAEFPEIGDTLRNIAALAGEKPYVTDIDELRKNLRARRVAYAFAIQQAIIQESTAR